MDDPKRPRRKPYAPPTEPEVIVIPVDDETRRRLSLLLWERRQEFGQRRLAELAGVSLDAVQKAERARASLELSLKVARGVGYQSTLILATEGVDVEEIATVDLRDEVVELRATNAELRAKLEATRARNAELWADLEATRARIGGLLAEMEAAKRESLNAERARLERVIDAALEGR